MKTIIGVLFLSNVALACPGYGTYSLEVDGKIVAVVDSLEATLEVNDGVNVEFVTSKLSADSDGADVLDDNGDWKWVCDNRPNMAPNFRAEREYCSAVQVAPGKYSLPIGLRDVNVSVNVEGQASVFKVVNANIDPNQPRGRGMGGCGTVIKPMN
jgi:hypothetical protein